ncbi:hypothetical protein Hanom_Chr16g01521401 [Helianthus anomalus]
MAVLDTIMFFVVFYAICFWACVWTTTFLWPILNFWSLFMYSSCNLDGHN